MIITSVVLLVTAFVLLIAGAVQGNATMLAVSLGAAGAGALALFAGNASAKRVAVARGVPIEAVLAGRVRRTPGGADVARTELPTPPPIDGYDDMPASEVTRLVATGALADEHLSEMLVYEASHQRRGDVLTAIMDVVAAGAVPPGDAVPATGRPVPTPDAVPATVRPVPAPERPPPERRAARRRAVDD